MENVYGESDDGSSRLLVVNFPPQREHLIKFKKRDKMLCQSSNHILGQTILSRYLRGFNYIFLQAVISNKVNSTK